MSFIWPFVLVLLLGLPLFVVLYMQRLRQRQALAARHASLGLAQAGGARMPGLRRHLPPALFLLSLAILIVAMARPQAVVSLPRLEGTVIIAFDVSASMAATDLEPTRLEAAKAAARAFVERQPETVRVGIVAFSNSGLSLQTPGNDTTASLAAIERLTPQRGTSVGQGILAALNLIVPREEGEEVAEGDEPVNPADEPDIAAQRALQETYESAVIVLLSDGENTANPDPAEAALTASELGVRIFTVGLGSPEGALLELEGFSVQTRLNEAGLQQIADMTGGSYFNAQQAEDLHDIYDQVAARLTVRPEAMEITSLLAAVGLAVLLLGGALSLAWFGHVP